MRLKPGRPDISRYADLFAVPLAAPDAPLTVTWLGVSTLLLDDGESAVLTDGFFSRPSLARVGLGRIAPSPPRIDGCLARLGLRRLDAVLPVHSHFDHVLDSAVVAERTGAMLVGGESTANVGRGHGLPDDRIVLAVPGEPLPFGAFDVTLIESHHCPPDRFPGHHHRTRAAAGEGLGLPVRRGMVDAGAPPPLRPAVSDPGQRGLRARACWTASAPRWPTSDSGSWVRSRSGT